MKNVLITGGGGIIGSCLVNYFFQIIDEMATETEDKIENLIVLDRLDYPTGWNVISEEMKAHSKVKLIEGDICDLFLVKFILQDYEIDTVFHLAAQTHVDLSFDNSLQFTQDNILGTHILLEACRKYGKLKLFVHQSTDEVYGSGESHENSKDDKSQDNPSDENSPIDATNPYSSSKAAAEFLVKSYGYSYNFPYIIIRSNNVYGPNQYPNKLIPKFILLLHQDKKLPIHGDGSAKRSFIHVLDLVRGIITIAKKGLIGEIYNIGSRNEYSVNEITLLLCNLMNRDFKSCVTYVKDRNFQDKRYYIDISKVSKLGWKEQIPFDQGLKETILWYLEHYDSF